MLFSFDFASVISISSSIVESDTRHFIHGTAVDIHSMGHRWRASPKRNFSPLCNSSTKVYFSPPYHIVADRAIATYTAPHLFIVLPLKIGRVLSCVDKAKNIDGIERY